MNPRASDDSTVSVRTWIGVLGAILGAFMAVLDIQITNASLANILGSLGATLEEGSWISTSYLVAEIVVIPLTGWLAVVFSTRWYLLANSVLFLASSILCGMAWNLPSMICFRVLQGFTGGVLIPMAFNIILTTLPSAKRPVGFALFGVTATFAPAIGPTIGGWLTESYGWPSIFYMNLIPGGVLIAAIAYALPAERLRLRLLRHGDWAGVVTMAIGLGCLTTFLEEGNRKDWFGSALITSLALTALIALTACVAIELRRREPFLNLRLLRQRNFALGSIVNIILGVGLYGVSYVLPLYLSQIQGYNAMQIGQTIMWLGVPQLFVLPLVPWLMNRFDARFLISLGAALFASSCFMNSAMTHWTAMDQLRWSQLVRAFGSPLIFVPLTALATGQIPSSQAGSASSLFNMLRNLGGSIGIAVLSTMVTRREQLHSVRVGEKVTVFDPATAERLDQLTSSFVARGHDGIRAGQEAISALASLVRREAFVMAYNDAFLIVALIMALSAVVVWCCAPAKGAAEGAH
jgi:MFS transporter, DHA2 family, multidrug resistance protein